MQQQEMKKSRIIQERLFAALRFKGIKNLGIVERVYFEAKGVFSIVTYLDEKPRKGLCILPEIDQEFREEMKFDAMSFACKSCGNVDASIDEKISKCKNCSATEWENAIISNA